METTSSELFGWSTYFVGTIKLNKFEKKNRMKIEIKSINSSISKAYLSKNQFLDEINLFKENYLKLFQNIKATDNEETLKDYINKFLDNTYYKNKFAIKENINNCDLVIYNGNSESDKIGVIIETKAIKNNAEMISENDFNKKGFHELILYFLDERITNSNIEIKNLIITNSKDWFVFDASEFERIFFHNKQLQKNFADWNNKKLLNNKRDWFYNEIAKPFIENSDETIFCTHFQLSENIEFSESYLVELYKIFSPEHLLKLPFANDSNTLNLDFYSELLHIIGLYETKDNARKIERLPAKDRYEGSFLENIIYIMESDDVLQKIENPQEFGQTNEEQIFSIALELCLTWVNRIIFLKLLESQLVKYNNNDSEFVFLTHEKIKDFETLKELFFEVLAVTPHDRRSNLKEKYQKVPYLNSSLFEPTVLEKEAVKINHLKQNTELPISNTSVLKDANGKKITGKLPVLKYFLDFLDSYNFASDRKIEIQEKQKTLINSAVLGLIFEKLNGYKEGSFFTPGYVTMYICRETIRNTVVQKFNTTFGWKCKTIIDIRNNLVKHDIDYQKANKTFNSIHICDPAVGSGHFLVSALNEMIAIKSEIKIIIDKNGEILGNVYCEVENDELFITHFDKLFSYNFHDKENQRIQETLFNEKRTIIENCLFGVDINPKSVQICRLRLWIELLKNAYYKPAPAMHAHSLQQTHSQQRELETLPNIDINIKCGNSLVSFFNFNGNEFSNGQLSKIQKFTKEYKTQVALYKDATEKKEKEKIVNHIKTLRQHFIDYANPNDKEYKELKKKESEHGLMPLFFNKDEQIQWQMKQTRLQKEITELQKNIETKHKNLYYNAFEWRFEFPEVLDDNGYFIGFDAIVGNPPYIYARNRGINEHLKKYYYENYNYQSSQLNTFGLFIEKSFLLTNKTGNLGFIVPNNLLTLDDYLNIRKFILDNTGNILVTNNLDKVFEKANVDTCIINFNKLVNEKITIAEMKEEKISFSIDIEKKQILAPEYFFTIKNFKNKEIESIIKKIETNSVLLKEIATISTGLKVYQTGKGKPAQTDEIKKNRKFHSSESHNKNYGKYLHGSDVSRYLIKWSGEYLNYGEWIAEPRKSVPFIGKRILVRQIPSKMPYSINATITEEQYYHDINSMVIFNSKQYDLKYILAILNSKLISYWFQIKYDKLQRNIFPQFRVKELAKFPILKIDVKDKNYIELLNFVEIIYQKKDIEAHSNKIDKLVYKLYNLSKDEIKIIENETA